MDSNHRCFSGNRPLAVNSHMTILDGIKGHRKKEVPSLTGLDTIVSIADDIVPCDNYLQKDYFTMICMLL